MLALEERFMIRELYRKGVSISEIARQTGRDRKTIRQAVNAPDLLPPKHPRQVKVCKIDPYAPYLELRMAEGVLNARKLYGEILAQGYPGKESKVREFVHERRPDKEPTGTVRFETAAFRARASRLGILWVHHAPWTHLSALRLRHDAGLVASLLPALYDLFGYYLVHSVSPARVCLPGRRSQAAALR